MSRLSRFHDKDIRIVATGEVCRYPMPMLAVPIPLLSKDSEAVVVLPRYMDSAQWDEMLRTIDVIRPALTRQP